KVPPQKGSSTLGVPFCLGKGPRRVAARTELIAQGAPHEPRMSPTLRAVRLKHDMLRRPRVPHDAIFCCGVSPVHTCTVRRVRHVSDCFLKRCYLFGCAWGVHSVHAHAIKACISVTCSVHTLLDSIALHLGQHSASAYCWGVHGGSIDRTAVLFKTYAT